MAGGTLKMARCFIAWVLHADKRAATARSLVVRWDEAWKMTCGWPREEGRWEGAPHPPHAARRRASSPRDVPSVHGPG